MAEFNGNNNNNRYEMTFISRVKFSDPDNNLNLNFKFWKGLLIVEIQSYQVGDGGPNYNTINSAYISPVKARMLADAIEEFMADPKHCHVGISLGSSDIQKCVTVGHGPNADILYICDLTPDGRKEKEAVFTFSNNHFYTINYSKYEKDIECDPNYQNGIELLMIKDLLRDFARAMLGAFPYGVMDYGRFQNTHTENNFNKIFDKLGIERASDGGYNRSRGSSNNSFFNRQGIASSSRTADTSSVHKEIEDLDDLLDMDDTLED